MEEILPIIPSEGEKIVDTFGRNSNPTTRMLELNDYFSGKISTLYGEINTLVYNSKEKDISLGRLEEMLMYLNKAIFQYDGGN